MNRKVAFSVAVVAVVLLAQSVLMVAWRVVPVKILKHEGREVRIYRELRPIHFAPVLGLAVPWICEYEYEIGNDGNRRHLDTLGDLEMALENVR